MEDISKYFQYDWYKAYASRCTVGIFSHWYILNTAKKQRGGPFY